MPPTAVPVYTGCADEEAEVFMEITVLVNGRVLDRRDIGLKRVAKGLLEIEPKIRDNGDGTFPIESEWIAPASQPSGFALKCADGISSKTGRGIGFISSVYLDDMGLGPLWSTTRPVNGRSSVTVVVSISWDLDDSSGRAHGKLTIPIDQRFEQKLSDQATVVAEFREPKKK